MWAPHHITYENETFQEFLFRQPRSYSELMQVVCGAANDPLAGWAYDGDDHWTPALVREWWRDRRRLAEWMRRDLRTWMASDEPEQKDAAHGIAEYAAYLEDGLEDYLRNYVFWLSERRAPAANQRLPVL
jgi:hypothetical protein